jgi:DNA-binding transcriptional LysR family regulator
MCNNDAMSDFTSIRVFLAVAAERSFAGAARQLAMTPATVTRTIAALEAALGVQLLLRTTRRVSLTAAGMIYAERAAPLLAGFEAAADAVREAEGVTSGLIRISAPMSLGLLLMPDVISQFRTLYPETRLSLRLSDRLVDILTEDFDLAIRISAPPRDKSTIWRKLCPVPRLLVASPQYLTQTGMPASPADLKSMVCLGYSGEGRQETWTLSKAGEMQSVSAGAAISANSGDLLLEMALRHEGVALLPYFIVEAALTSGALSPVLADWAPPELWLTLYYPPYQALPLRVAAFSEFFETFVTETRPLGPLDTGGSARPRNRIAPKGIGHDL